MIRFLSQIILLLVVSEAIGTNQENETSSNHRLRGVKSLCPDMWTQFHGSCYFLFEDEEEWSQANYICETFKGHLVIIESKEENAFVENYVRTKQVTKADVWVGASDIMVQGEFRWVGTNKPVTFTDWAPGNPSLYYDGQRENCMELYATDNFLWNDARCYNRNHYMCEISAPEIIG